MQPTDQWGNPVAQQPPMAQQPFPQQLHGQPAQVVVGGQPVVMAGTPGMAGMAFPVTSATTALVLSIVSIFCGGICLAIPALFVANGALNITNRYSGHPDAGTAKAAQIVSWVVIGLTIVVLLFYGVAIAAVFASDSSGGF